jgi:hypothetical protein
MTARTILPESSEIAPTSPPQSKGLVPQSVEFGAEDAFQLPKLPQNPTPSAIHGPKNRHNFSYSCDKNSKVILEHQATGTSCPISPGICETSTFPFPNLILPLPITSCTAIAKGNCLENTNGAPSLQENTQHNPPPALQPHFNNTPSYHLQHQHQHLHNTMPFIGVSLETEQQHEIMEPSPTLKNSSLFYSSTTLPEGHTRRKAYEHRQMKLQHSTYIQHQKQEIAPKQPALSDIIKPRERIIEMEVGPEDYADLVQEKNYSVQHLNTFRHQSQEDEAASGLLKLAMKAEENTLAGLNVPQLRASASTSRLVAIHPATRRSVVGSAASGVSKFMNSPTRRQAHIVSEQKRRQTINEGFDELRFLVPTCHNLNDSKATILKKTVNYLKSLQQKIEELSASGVHNEFPKSDDSAKTAPAPSEKKERPSRGTKNALKAVVPSPESCPSEDLSIEEDKEKSC